MTSPRAANLYADLLSLNLSFGKTNITWYDTIQYALRTQGMDPFISKSWFYSVPCYILQFYTKKVWLIKAGLKFISFIHVFFIAKIKEAIFIGLNTQLASRLIFRSKEMTVFEHDCARVWNMAVKLLQKFKPTREE